MSGREHAALLVCGAVLVGAAVTATTIATTTGPAGGGELVVSGGVPVSAAVVPVAVPAPGPAPASSPQDSFAGWAARQAGPTGVPARALQAYAAADATLRAEQPGCGLTWVTLAAIGRIESDHGRYAGRALLADGRPDDPIIGIALDGRPGVATITDTDDGLLDGDPALDRAVGPMQLIPSTWQRWGTDGDGDGRADPQDLDDVAVAAGRYLCAGGGDLTDGTAWLAAVLSYNRSTEYAADVLAHADAYAQRSRG